MAQARELARREAAFYLRIGVDGFVCWFGKLAPYDAPDFYWLAPTDLERFGIREVAVSDAPAPPGAAEDSLALRVDWDLLPATRPAVSLDP